jgi:hypothetical protein
MNAAGIDERDDPLLACEALTPTFAKLRITTLIKPNRVRKKSRFGKIGHETGSMPEFRSR